MPDLCVKEQRSVERRRVHWQTIVVFDEVPGRPSIGGETLNLAADGAAVLVGRNVPDKGHVTLLLKVPPIKASAPQQTIQISSRIVGVVLSPQVKGFRLGLHFLKFMNDDEKHLLESRLIGNG